MKLLEDIAVPVDINDNEQVMKALDSCIGTKFAHRWGKLISNLALQATRLIFFKMKCFRIVMKGGNINKLNLEIKRYAKVEKIPGGILEDC